MATFETIDFEELDGTDTKRPDDMSSLLMGFVGSLNFKSLFILFIIFIFVTSNVFVDKILGNIGGASEHKSATTKGAFIQGFALVFMFVCMNAVIAMEIL